jgi:hypothetical protein
MDTAVARKMHRTLEPYHGVIYFAPEPREEYAKIGLRGQRMGYFASRSAAMGPVSAEVVIATFFNFYPGLVRGVIPAAWSLASPESVLHARLTGIDRTLRRVLGGWIEGADVVEAADLARQATAGCFLEGHPLYAAHAALPWPDEPHLVLWHALTLLREFRGDGHIAAMTTQGLGALDALLIHEATGVLPVGVLQSSRAWPDDEWAAGRSSLEKRGVLHRDGTLTEQGQLDRQWVEDVTDRLELTCWELLGPQQCDRLRDLVRPASRLLSAELATGSNRELD